MKTLLIVEDEKIKIYTEKTKLAIKTSKTLMISKIIEGHYPDYNKLIPETSPKTAKVNRNELISALELISVMVNEKTCIIKFEFSENKLEVKADTSDSGKGKKDLDIEYSDEDLVIAFNYKYVLDGLKNMEDEKLKRRVERNLAKMNIPSTTSKEAFYILECEENYTEKQDLKNNSRTRILDMTEKLEKVKNGDYNAE